MSFELQQKALNEQQATELMEKIKAAVGDRPFACFVVVGDVKTGLVVQDFGNAGGPLTYALAKSFVESYERGQVINPRQDN